MFLDKINRIKERYIIISVGIGTFFFGFFAGAVASAYLLSIHSQLVAGLRTSLSFKSAIFGDGFILPVINMVAAAFLLANKKLLTKALATNSVLLGFLITAYFHLNQAINKLVNWAMPTPWHWNILGLWHAIYMFSVSAFISLFYIIVMRNSRYGQRLPKEFFIVTTGLV